MSARYTVVSSCLPKPYGQKAEVGPHELRVDEPEDLDGKDSGPTPYELLLAALGGCTNITLTMYARQKGWELNHISTKVTHQKVEGEGGVKVDVFTREITMDGPLDDTQRKRLLEIADKCPVSRTLENPARMLPAVEAE